MTHENLVRLDSNSKSTAQLLGECLLQMNQGNRVTFLTDVSMGMVVVQRLRMKLSRVRLSMDAKGAAKQHFRLNARCYPYTNAKGKRFDCVVLEKIKTREHEIAEAIERMVKNGESGRNVKAPTTTDNTDESGVEW